MRLRYLGLFHIFFAEANGGEECMQIFNEHPWTNAWKV